MPRQAGREIGFVFPTEPADLGTQVHGHQAVATIFHLASFRDFGPFSRG
jgi:hypothetical protein